MQSIQIQRDILSSVGIKLSLTGIEKVLKILQFDLENLGSALTFPFSIWRNCPGNDPMFPWNIFHLVKRKKNPLLKTSSPDAESTRQTLAFIENIRSNLDSSYIHNLLSFPLAVYVWLISAYRLFTHTYTHRPFFTYFICIACVQCSNIVMTLHQWMCCCTLMYDCFLWLMGSDWRGFGTRSWHRHTGPYQGNSTCCSVTNNHCWAAIFFNMSARAVSGTNAAVISLAGG